MDAKTKGRVRLHAQQAIGLIKLALVGDGADIEPQALKAASQHLADAYALATGKPAAPANPQPKA